MRLNEAWEMLVLVPDDSTGHTTRGARRVIVTLPLSADLTARGVRSASALVELVVLTGPSVIVGRAGILTSECLKRALGRREKCVSAGNL